MLREAVDGRRLRFPLETYADESVPGAIARAARAHVLVRTAPVFEAAGVTMKHAGYSQLASNEELERLAYVIRCSPENLTSKAGERVIAATGSMPVDSRFGRLILPRMYIELDRRRIAPTSLSRHGYHRLGWLNLLLPYAEDTFERMVSSCTGCGAALEWRYARGIEACDVCGCIVPPSEEPELQCDLREDYQVFAQLSSLHPDTIDSACAQLPATLRSVAPGTLIRLALQIGGIVQNPPVIAASRRVVAGLSEPLVAKIAAAGSALLRTWPHGIRSWMATRSEELRDVPAELTATRTRLRRLVDRQREAPDLVDLVLDALPELKMSPGHGFQQGRRYYLYNDVARSLGLNSPQMASLRKWQGLEFRRLSASTRQIGQFDADQIDGLKSIFRNTVPFNTCSNRFKIPLYAIEQLCEEGLLAWEDHPAIAATRSTNGIRSQSVEEFSKHLVGRALVGAPPQGCVSLSKAVRRIGGRLKPWASIVRDLLSGDLPFWIIDESSLSTGILVRPAEIAAFDRTPVALHDAGFLPSATMSQMDAAEVLNIKPALLPEWGNMLRLSFKRVGSALVVPRADVEDTARQVAWNTEVAWHLRIKHRQVESALLRRNIRRVTTGWCRRQLREEGILPREP